MTLEPHIPAWKRLGLKLKFAKDEPPLDPPIVDSKKRKAEDALLSQQDDKLERTSRVAKRAKASPASATNGHKAVNREEEYDDYNATTTTQPHANGEEESVKASTATKPKPRDRKSVSFTPGTKEADGQSMKNLYQAWVKTQQNGIDSGDGIAQTKSNGGIVTNTEVAGEGQDGQPLGEATTSPDETISASTTNGDVSSNHDPTNDGTPPTPKKSKKKKKKGTKKSKTTRLNSAPPSSSPHPPPDTSSSNLSPPPSSTPFPPAPHPPPSSHPSSTPTATALTYLTTFHTSPSTWKFSKNNQTSLLKHILSLAKIPPKHNPALLAYLKGLQGRAAKGDLRKRALEARQADEVWLAGKEKKGDGDPDGEDTLAGMDGTPKEQYESQWRGKLIALLRKNSEQQAGLQSTDNNDTANTHDNEHNEEDDNDDKAKALKWRINRRVRAELILLAVGDASASPSPEPAPKPSSITANNATATTAIRSSVAASIGGKQHIKFDDDDAAAAATVDGKSAHDDDEPRRRLGMKEVNVNGVHNKPGRPAPAAAPAPAPATANNRSSNQPKKRKRKRKSRIRTAGRNSDSEKSSSSDSSSSDSSDESS